MEGTISRKLHFISQDVISDFGTSAGGLSLYVNEFPFYLVFLTLYIIDINNLTFSIQIIESIFCSKKIKKKSH